MLKHLFNLMPIPAKMYSYLSANIASINMGLSAGMEYFSPPPHNKDLQKIPKWGKYTLSVYT